MTDQSLTISNDMMSDNWALARVCRRQAPWPVNGRIKFPLNTFLRQEAFGDGVDIYIISGGVDSAHAELSGRVTKVYEYFASAAGNPDPIGIGTQLASLAAGSGVGLAKNAEIFSFKVTTNNTTNAINTTSMNTVMTQVLSHYNGRSGLNRPAVVLFFITGLSTTYRGYLSSLIAAGMVVIVGAGQLGIQIPNSADVPAMDLDTLAIGASDIYDNIWQGDTNGNYSRSLIQLYAPGVGLKAAQSSTLGGGYITVAGTEYAAAVAGGIAACILSGKPRLTKRSEVHQIYEELYRQSTKGAIRRASTVYSSEPDSTFNMNLVYLDPTVDDFDLTLSPVSEVFDPYYRQVQFHYNFEGLSNGTSSVSDLGPLGKTLTFGGGATIQSGGLSIDADGEYVEITNDADVRAASDTSGIPDWTFECEFMLETSMAANNQMGLIGMASETQRHWIFSIYNGGFFEFNYTAANGAVSGPIFLRAEAIEVGKRYHLVISYTGAAFYFFINGKMTWFLADSSQGLYQGTSQPFRVGYNIGMTANYVSKTPRMKLYWMRQTRAIRYGPGIHRMYVPVDSSSDGLIQKTGSSYSSATTSSSATLSASAAVDDTMFVVVQHRSALTIPSGWSVHMAASESGAADYSVTILSKPVVSGEIGNSISFSQASSGPMEMVMFVWRKAGIALKKTKYERGVNGVVNGKQSFKSAFQVDAGDVVIGFYLSSVGFTNGGVSLDEAWTTAQQLKLTGRRMAAGIQYIREDTGVQINGLRPTGGSGGATDYTMIGACSFG